MTTTLQSASVKSLALLVLQEMAARREVLKVCAIPAGYVGQEAGGNTSTEEMRRDGLSPCGSPNCAGCYDVGDGRKIHPPKASAEWLAWLERWKPKGKLQ